MNSPYIICNWKMNPQTEAEAKTLARAIADVVHSRKQNIIIIPPIVFLDAVKNIYSPVGVQDISEYVSGAHTGQISARMAREKGSYFAIIGRSERRREQHETDIQVAQKVICAREAELIPIICIGEIKKKPTNATWQEVKKQLDVIMPSLKNAKKYLLAYEPAWAIGGNKTVNGAYVKEMIYRIKLYVRAKNKYIPAVLYGGSVDGKSIESLLHYRDVIDGFLVGSASVDIKKIISLIKKVYGTA